MIVSNNEEKIIHLNNGSISYVLYITEEGFVENIYYGKSLKNVHTQGLRGYACCASKFYDMNSGEEVAYKNEHKIEYSPMEISSHGFSDKRYSPIVVQHANGCFETDFRYVKHTIYNGLRALEGQPHAHGEDCETLEILFKDRYSDVYLKENITIFHDKDIIVKNFVVENQGTEAVALLHAQSMQLDLKSTDYQLVHFHGRYNQERNYTENSLVDGAQEIASNFGTSSHYENPFVFLKKKDANNAYGEVIGFNLIYSGNFKFRIECNHFNNAHIVYGINDEDFQWELKEKESFVTPQAVLSYSYAGVDKMSQTFHRYIKEILITYDKDTEYKPIIFNSWEGCYFTFNTDSILSYIQDALQIGTELFVLDDGWFGRRNADNSSLGDWWVNHEKIDLHKVIDFCHDKGMKFGIWFEPEMLSYRSNLYKEHPDFALGVKGKDQVYLWRHQFCLDMVNPQAVEIIYQQIRAFLEEYPVDYIKWDYNRIVAEHTSCYLGNQQGEVYHRLVLGYYHFIERITRDYPAIMIEGCAGGGARFDMGTLFYTPQIWASDESNPIRRMVINYNTSLGYPLSCIGTHVNACKAVDYKSKALFALFGTYGYEMNPNKLTDEEKSVIFQVAELYKTYHKDVIGNGTLYHLSSPNESEQCVMQCVNQKQDISLVLYINKVEEYNRYRFLKVEGLCKDKLYKNNVDGQVYDGEYLMQVGLNLTKQSYQEFDVRLIILEEFKA